MGPLCQLANRRIHGFNPAEFRSFIDRNNNFWKVTGVPIRLSWEVSITVVRLIQQ